MSDHDDYLRNLSGHEEYLSDLVDVITSGPDKFPAEKLCTQLTALRLVAESPIEEILGLALMDSDWQMTGLYTSFDHSAALPEGVHVFPQARIGSFRVDFLIVECRRGQQRTLVVECDGHEFHERTKEQARRDRSRDRQLMSMGFPVIRFTGSEIFRDPFCCCAEVLNALYEVRRVAA